MTTLGGFQAKTKSALFIIQTFIPLLRMFGLIALRLIGQPNIYKQEKNI